jgi:hypothetical protein
MVRIKLIVRVIPEGVYINAVEPPIEFPEEKRLLKMVNEPENVSIGKLVNEIKEMFQRINQESVLPRAGSMSSSLTNRPFLQASREYQIPQRWRSRRRP